MVKYTAMQQVYFISGIDTGIGKTIATGLMARALATRGVDVLTVKLVQTGNDGFSDEILTEDQNFPIRPEVDVPVSVRAEEIDVQPPALRKGELHSEVVADRHFLLRESVAVQDD